MMPDSISLEMARDGVEMVEMGQVTRPPLEGGQDGESTSARLLLNSWLADPVETGGWVQELGREQDGEVLDASSEDSEEEGATEEPSISVKKEVDRIWFLRPAMRIVEKKELLKNLSFV